MKVLKPIALCFALLALASCKPSVESVTKKITEGKQLDKADTEVVINYSRTTIDETADSLAAHRGDRAAMMHALMALSVKYPETNIMAAGLRDIDPNKLEGKELEEYKEVMARYEKIANELQTELGARIVTDVKAGGVKTDVSEPESEPDTIPTEQKLTK